MKESRDRLLTTVVCPLSLLVGLACAPAFAQKTQKAQVDFPDAPGKEVLLGKCFQCHGPNMWIAQRQDRRAWESALYRMVGRGALWTPEEIRAMADYLGTAYGRKER
ncbi:MAG TPA: cytochrome c [Usitatibacter sp.]|jgi:mono/diheme cytochrome c family protein|nr:cytochrome c [Usitatibacter sp.]